MGNDGGPGVTLKGMLQPNGVNAVPAMENPIIIGSNVYGANLHQIGSRWRLFYGGWLSATDINDRIVQSLSDDYLPEGPWTSANLAVANGNYIHVHDPSVSRHENSDWFMAYTVADRPDGETDKIAVSRSSDLVSFSPPSGSSTAEISVEIPSSSKNFTKMARPSLLWTGSYWKIWFDGRIDGADEGKCFLAHSEGPDPFNYVLQHIYEPIGSFPSFFESDVRIVNGAYKAIVQRNFDRLVFLESVDGVSFVEVGEVLSTKNNSFVRKYISNPGWILDEKTDSLLGVVFGMTSEDNLTNHDIGFSYFQFTATAWSGDVAHTQSSSRYFDETVLNTYEYDRFDRIQVGDQQSGRVLVDQVVDSS